MADTNEPSLQFTIEAKVDLEYIAGTIALALADGWDPPDSRKELEEMIETQLLGGGVEACEGWEYAYNDTWSCDPDNGLPTADRVRDLARKILGFPTS